ncbi:MAG: methyltransferase domain-containing protein [Candidatus Pacearchaeota archaeon]|nr:methyltransferase domain-containing protein [Candidatus Pacearchaeota archaeon]
MANYDIIGNTIIVKFDKNTKASEKKKIAKRLLAEHKGARTILEKVEKFSGRLRTLKTKYVFGEKTKEAIYKENGCIFRLNVDKCYFSPRLSTERKEIAEQIRKGEDVLVMFGGIGVFAIVIAKNGKAKKIVSVELGRECNKYAVENVKRNKLNNVELIQGDVRKKVPKLKEKFDRIVMPRPNLKDSFLDIAFKKIKKNGIIHYYGFYKENESEKLRELIYEEAKKAKREIDILKIKKAGEIGVRKYRYRVDFVVKN